MTELRVGDIVLVGKPADPQEYPYWDSAEMDRYAGRLMTVKSTDGVEFSTIEAGDWLFSVSWIRHIPTYSGRVGYPDPNKETLRDRFAMAALTGLLAGNVETFGSGKAESVSSAAYWIADKMMAERERAK